MESVRVMGEIGTTDRAQTRLTVLSEDFSLIGVIAIISAILADNGIGIFVVSTFNTDYILTKSDRFEEALRLLSTAGYITCS